MSVGIFRNSAKKITEATHAYGAQWDVTNTSPAVTRVGNLSLHATLPIHRQMKGCLLKNDGTVNYYLKPDDWTKKTDGTASDLSGTDGQVMTEIPEFYWKFNTDDNTRTVMLSEFPIVGYTRVPKMYISAYEAALEAGNKLASVKNPTLNSGLPKTSVSRTNFRTYARNRGTGWEMYFFLAHKVLFWLYIVEFANRNSQLPVNGLLTEHGFRQGGLGIGVTDAASAEWAAFNGSSPFIKCGASDWLGNFTGAVAVEIANFKGVGSNQTFLVPRYRGIENPFGHIWKNCDGVNINIQADGAGGESRAFVCNDPAKFNDSNYNGYTNEGLLPRANGYMSKVIFGETGNFLPNVAAGLASTYFCDYFYTSVPATGESLRTLLLGGTAHDGSYAGLGYSNSYFSPSDTSTTFGSRLCFFGA